MKTNILFFFTLLFLSVSSGSFAQSISYPAQPEEPLDPWPVKPIHMLQGGQNYTDELIYVEANMEHQNNEFSFAVSEPLELSFNFTDFSYSRGYGDPLSSGIYGLKVDIETIEGSFKSLYCHLSPSVLYEDGSSMGGIPVGGGTGGLNTSLLNRKDTVSIPAGSYRLVFTGCFKSSISVLPNDTLLPQIMPLTSVIPAPRYFVTMSFNTKAIAPDLDDPNAPIEPELPPIPGAEVFSLHQLPASLGRNSTCVFDSQTGDFTLGNLTVNYLDDLGRPDETVQKEFTTGTDLVVLQEYDAWGRKSNLWLPAAVTQNAGNYVQLGQCQNASKQTNSGDTSPYSSPVYEQSPLSRILKQYGPGSDWRAKSKAIKTSYFTNIAGNDTLNCLYFMASIGLYSYGQVTTVRNYATGSLSVVRTENEDGETLFEFTDRSGRMVLSRRIERTSTGKKNHDTNFIYDDLGQLLAVLPPLLSDKAVANRSFSSEQIADYAFLYEYDTSERQIGKKLPGADWEYMIYDHADRLVFSQNGKQRLSGEWSFYISDVLGRVCLTGTCKNRLNVSKTSFITPIKCLYNEKGDLYKGYQISGVELVSPVLQSVYYYDNYRFLTRTGFPIDLRSAFQYASVTGFGEKYQNARGLLTGTWVAHLGGTEPSSDYTVMYYDERDRAIQTISTNHLGGIEKEYMSYNFRNQPLRRRHVHTVPGKATQTELYTYTYDSSERLLTAKHQLNSGAEVLLADNEYDALGRLKSNKRNSLAGLKSVYTYTLRSWMKSITGPLFSQTLYYQDSYKGKNRLSYSGNISAMDWSVPSDKNRAYTFNYDNLSRLINASYLENDVASTHYRARYSYDKHGNITSLTRQGRSGTTAYNVIDSLSLAYHGNQLVAVSDVAANPTLSQSADFKNGANQSVEYTYDPNGNMLTDLNKGIREISYNSLNLPSKLVISNSVGSATNTYLYGADGRKLCVTMQGGGSNSKNTDYVGNMIYENGSLKRILIDGGYIENGVYHYYLQDHLSNNRVVVKADGTVVQTNHYYPYGMSFAEGIQTSSQPYKYNNKELDSEHGLNLYDYVARGMDPVFGRFTGIDPMAEKYYDSSPYVYCANNPINCVDLDGRDWYRIKDDNGEWKYNYNDNIHSQKELEKSIGRGEYLGQVYTNNNIYYSLFGSRVTADSFEGAIYKLLDTAIIKETNAKLEEYGYSGGEDLVRSPVTDFSIRGVNAKDSKYLGLDSHRNEHNIRYENSSSGVYIVYEDKTQMRGEMTDWIGYPDQPKVIHGYFSGDSKPMYHIRFINKSCIEGDIVHLEYNAPAAKIILTKYYNLFPKLRK